MPQMRLAVVDSRGVVILSWDSAEVARRAVRETASWSHSPRAWLHRRRRSKVEAAVEAALASLLKDVHKL